jgi:hypothetical protein
MKILEKILSDAKQRAVLINEFQARMWNGNGYGNDENINNILSELAYDLDFYEPNEEWRKESHSYYGEERFKYEVQCALQKIKENKSSTVLNRL